MLSEAPNLSGIQSAAGINSSFSDLGGLISQILPYVFGAAGIALLIYLVFGGFNLMTSQGDPKKAQAAQSIITNALIGFVIVVIAYIVVQLFGQLFGVGTFGGLFR